MWTRPAINAWTWWSTILALYDVVVTNPVSQEVLTSNCVNTRATRVQAQVKERRYRDAAQRAGMTLHGLAIEVYGAWGNDFNNMFTHFISLGAVVTNIPKAILANYWRRRISVCLQRGYRVLQPRRMFLPWSVGGAVRGIQGRIPDCLWRGGGLLGVWHNECLG
jgi:hypothetical protein